MNNVIPFPGQNELEGMKSSQAVAKNVAKGKKVTQQQAFGALMEMRQLVDGVINAVGRLSQSQVGYENILQRIDTNLGVLMSMLMDKDVFNQEDWDTAWKKYVLDPQEEALTKHIEEMKRGSAEDAFFAEVVNMVRAHDWQDKEAAGRTVPARQVKEFYIQMLLNPATRRHALNDLRKEIPEVPELNPEELEKKDETQAKAEEERKLPDCRYCGKPDCEFCSSLVEEAKPPVCAPEAPHETYYADEDEQAKLEEESAQTEKEE